MKNIHILSTNKPSRLYSYKNNLFLTTGSHLHAPSMEYQNIYITNSEEIKEGDWCLDIKRNIIFQSKRTEIGTSKKIPIIICTYEGCYVKEDCKKIILTTDQYLIKDGVQAIDDEFLEWFVKNPSCEYAEVKRIFLGNSFVHIGKTPSKKEKLRGCYDNGEQIVGKWKELFTYEIIIPKEEPKQETLEEVKDLVYWKANAEEDYLKVPISVLRYISELENVVKKSYSEEEVLEILLNLRGENPRYIEE
jgi:hypothetical protein